MIARASKKIMRCLGLVALVMAAGCSSTPREEAVPAARVLAGPYALRLTVTPEVAHPGERVLVGVEFQNTGSAPLWVPRGREVFLGYRNKFAGGEFWSSSCDGIMHVRLRANETVRYEQSFEVPAMYGMIEIYASVRRDVSVPLRVEPPPRLDPAPKNAAGETAAARGLRPAAVHRWRGRGTG